MNMIAPTQGVRQRQRPMRYTPEEKRFNKWLHQGGSCCLTDFNEFQIAHTGGLAQGKGMGVKSWLGTALPIRRELHLIEERRRETFWEQVGFPDYLQWAADLYEHHKSGGDPMNVLQEMHRQADRTIIADMLTNPNNF